MTKNKKGKEEETMKHEGDECVSETRRDSTQENQLAKDKLLYLCPRNVYVSH